MVCVVRADARFARSSARGDERRRRLTPSSLGSRCASLDPLGRVTTHLFREVGANPTLSRNCDRPVVAPRSVSQVAGLVLCSTTRVETGER